MPPFNRKWPLSGPWGRGTTM